MDCIISLAVHALDTCFHLSARVDKYRPNAKEYKSARATKDDGGRPRPCQTNAQPGVAASWVRWARKWTTQVLAGRVAAPIVHLHLKDAREGTLPALAV